MAGADKPRSTDSRPKRVDRDGAVRIETTPIAKQAAALPKTLYIAGTCKDSPLHNVHVRGICFHRFSGGRPVFEDGATVTHGPSLDGEPPARKRVDINDARKLGAARWGCLVPLNDLQVEEICRDVGLKFVRRRGDAAQVVSSLSPSFKGSDGLDPLAHHLYLVRANSVTGEQAETGEYPPMAAEKEKARREPEAVTT